MKIKINWVYLGHTGYWRSSEGRFDIQPGGWVNSNTPEFYELFDEFKFLRDKASNPNVIAKSKIGSRFDSVKDAKLAALSYLQTTKGLNP